MGKIKTIFTRLVNIFSWLVVIAVFAGVTTLVGELVNYSPWSLLIVDIIFIFAINKLVNRYYHNEHYEAKKKGWLYFFIIIALLGVSVSISVASVYSWAMLNIIMLAFLLIFFLIFFSKKKERFYLENLS